MSDPGTGDLARFVEEFEGGTVSGECFNHAAHLRVAVFYLHRARHDGGPAGGALERARQPMEEGLRRLLARLGKPETAYHETVTRAWLMVLSEHLAREDRGQPVDELAGQAAQLHGQSGRLQVHYSDERLGSPLARARWLVPDREPLPGQDWHVRRATPDDLDAINRIYNHYVPISTCTFDLEPTSAEARRGWFDDHDAHHPITVAVSTADGRVAGWGSVSSFRSRPAYAHSVETSVYLDAGTRGRGLGRQLLDDLLERARALGHHTVIAGVTADQPASLALHRNAGFEDVARFREVGWKHGRWLDVVFLQRHLRSL